MPPLIELPFCHLNDLREVKMRNFAIRLRIFHTKLNRALRRKTNKVAGADKSTYSC